MRPELTEKVLQRLETAMQSVGSEGYDKDLLKLAAFLKYLSENIDRIKTRDELQTVLNQLPEPSFTEEKLILTALNYIPHILRYGVKKLGEAMKETLPEPPS